MPSQRLAHPPHSSTLSPPPRRLISRPVVAASSLASFDARQNGGHAKNAATAAITEPGVAGHLRRSRSRPLPRPPFSRGVGRGTDRPPELPHIREADDRREAVAAV